MNKDLSLPAQAFLRFVESNPECLDRSNFQALDSPNAFVKYPLNSWPTFIDAAEASEIERVGVGFSRLIKSIPQRFFTCDPVRLQGAYGLHPGHAAMTARFLRRPESLDLALGRGDFMETGRGLQCLEFNCTSNLGGWRNGIWADLYRQVPVLQRFFSGSGFEFGYVETLALLFAHVLKGWWIHRDPAVDELNILFLVRMPESVPAKRNSDDPGEAHAQRVYRETREKLGLKPGGTVIVAPLEEVQSRGDQLYVGDVRIHVVLEFLTYQPEPMLVKSMLSGNSLVLNGPISYVLSDKKNLSLLSEHAASPLFEAQERELIRNHLPWTRTVAPDFTTFEGRRVHLPDLLVAERERLVLKTRRGSRGDGVLIGRFTEPEAWTEAVRKALDDGLSIVQEFVEPNPRPHQIGASGTAPCDVVWGLFVFGETFAGSFLRLVPSGFQGIINAAQGAEESVVFVAKNGGSSS
jgi:hypothetical protein